MQNTSSNIYTINSKIINMRSEILCRQAEDDFFYFNKVNSAYKKLDEAVKLSPYHYKSVKLLADVSFVKGNIKKALKLYLRALGIYPSACIYASIANCYNSLSDFKSALTYFDKALDLISDDDYDLFSQITELKINALIELKKYKQAYVTFIQSQNILDKNSLKSIYNINYEVLNEKIKLQQRLSHSNLKIV